MIHTIVSSYLDRALKHTRGESDDIRIKVQKLQRRPLFISTLKVLTATTKSLNEANTFVKGLLKAIGASSQVVKEAFDIIYGNENMRGAAMLSVDEIRRLEPDRERGVRTTELGITAEAESILSSKLSKFHLNNNTVKEAVILASKVANYQHVVAELCVSDDPDYTTGYFAVKEIGYVRIPHIKRAGDMCGGRIIFVNNSVDREELMHYLQEVPVIIDRVSDIIGEVLPDEFIRSLNSKSYSRVI